MNRNITADESLEALRNDRRELYEMFNPQLVRIEELTAPAGSMYLAYIRRIRLRSIVTGRLSKFTRDCGRAKRFTVCTNRQVCPGIGIRQFRKNAAR